MTSPDARFLDVVALGEMSYAESLELQRGVARGRIAGLLDEDVLLLVEHPHVVTLGRSFRPAHLVASPALLASRGVPVVEVERGGDVTYHGPGQLVGYPIIALRRHRQDLHWYLRQVEAALIGALSRVGILADRHAGFTGVWVGSSPSDASSNTGGVPRGEEIEGDLRKKIASIGVHARDWVTWHGFALNVTTDLSFFDLIVPCGIQGVEMTSIARESARGAPASIAARPVGDANTMMETVTTAVVTSFGNAFALRPRTMSLDELRTRLEAVHVVQV